jgi:hypothetical protein
MAARARRKGGVFGGARLRNNPKQVRRAIELPLIPYLKTKLRCRAVPERWEEHTPARQSFGAVSQESRQVIGFVYSVRLFRSLAPPNGTPTPPLAYPCNLGGDRP